MDLSKVKSFNYFVEEKKVKKIRPDIELAKSLLKNIEEREKTALKLDSNEFQLIIFENIYDCLRELLDAILALEGYKSYSHEAVIIYLKNFNFPESKIFDLNRFRIKRNNSKYYGKSPQVEDALEIKDFYLENKHFLIGIINERIK
jgi:hypothetical protein